ncbi:MAG: sugar phosphate isomerase/epimerase family protein [Candidatus Promineifilaceae bacterium]|nr:sugar phosphate isomerase/epimerase family protein [Candidatus Promineifilaceae bacterium]
MNQLLFATYHPEELALYRRRAEQLQCGLEIHAFSNPALLAANGDLKRVVATFEKQLAGFEGVLGFHGAFYDMVSASVDPDVVALTLQRYRQNVEVAHHLGGRYVVFHANYMGGFKLADYRDGWHRRQVTFWRAFMEEVGERGVTVLLENMWADDPSIIVDILAEVDHPRLQACLDVGHVYLFSDRPIEVWIDALEPFLYSCHLNNHNGRVDLHWSLGHGVIDYPPILRKLKELARPPFMTLEMGDWETIAASLPYFDLTMPA